MTWETWVEAKHIKRNILRQARATKSAMLTQWEEEWMNAKASLADQTSDKRHMGTVFQIIRELTQVREHRRRFGHRRHENPEAEAEAWKQHFSKIQEGEGEVADAIWGDISTLPGDFSWLGSPPTKEEIQRAINEMDTGRAPGGDLFMAEYLKFGGPVLHTEIGKIVRSVWKSASTANEGEEVRHWPKAWSQGVIFPLWKRKGDRHDKNTWRGITLLSVGSKLVARICAARLQRWTQPWLNPFQFGFRKGSGVDDVQQVTRSLIEEIAGSVHEKVILFRFFDQVARHALWRLLAVKGVPNSMIKILRALHNHTASSVRFEGHQSSEFIPERGLREGCPSSPILFNIYHHCIMEVFRARRARKALELNATPGIYWSYKVDGKIGKRKNDREEEGRNIRRCLIGDFAYADDTGLIGEAEEARAAERLFSLTISDFTGRVNAGKTEGLRVTSQAPPQFEVPFLGEANSVKHVGALLGVRGNHTVETQARINKTVQKLGWVASSWTQGRGAHRNKHRIKYSVRLRVMKTVVKGVLSSFAKTRAWQVNHLARAQKVIQMAIRRCLGVRMGAIHRAGLNNRVLTYFAQWESFDNLVRRGTLMWIGHIARMHVNQPQKVILFGWLEGAGAKEHAPPRQAQWINACLRAAKIPEADWFRLVKIVQHGNT